MDENTTTDKTAWTLIRTAFPILDNPSGDFEDITNTDDANFSMAVETIQALNLAEIMEGLVLNKVEERLRKRVVPRFWAYFSKDENKTLIWQFYRAVCSLFDHFSELRMIIGKLELIRKATGYNKSIYNTGSLTEAFKLIFEASILSQLPVDHQWLIEKFYEIDLKVQDPDDDDGPCGACEHNVVECTKYFQETNRKLGEMELIEPLISQVLTNLIYSHIREHIQEACKESFDSSHIATLETWLRSVVLAWVKKIYFNDAATTSGDFMEEFDKKVMNYLYNTYTKIRNEQLFNIIIEYPESFPALEDLRLCLPKTDLKPYLTRSLQKAMETRLLHPGVSTSDVLTAYVAAFRSLRVLDPSGLLLETIIQPVHQYLKGREDTVRCVITSLTEEGPNDLTEELTRGDTVQVDEHVEDDDDMQNWETWMPDPLHVVPRKPTVPRRSADIISMLVNVYGSKELFVNEYRTMLADRLLSQYTCDTQREIRYLELLKLRFGDSQLHFCEVMLKDIADSKRINQHIRQEGEIEVDVIEDEIPISAMIVSAQFWPPFKDETLELHKKLLDQREKFTKSFEVLKGSRTLFWKNHLGIVDLEIELSDRTLELSVSPVHATILMHFQDQKTWTLDALSKIMQVPPTILRRKLSFWQSHGIITENDPDVFNLQEEQEDINNARKDDIIVEDLESESAMASAQDQREEELQTFWSYIHGMLTNLDKLPLERIHQMLKMFAFQGPTIECNMQELKAFLDRKVREHQLIYSNGLYRLPK